MQVARPGGIFAPTEFAESIIDAKLRLALDTPIEVGINEKKYVVYAAIFGVELQDYIERAAERRMDTLLPQMMKAAGVTEELKARDQTMWVGLMNNCKARVEEIIFAEGIHS